MTLVELQGILIAESCNKADQVVVLIQACIAGGIDTGPEIVATVTGLGFTKSYVGLMLAKSAGQNPEQHRWARGEDGRYRSHD